MKLLAILMLVLVCSCSKAPVALTQKATLEGTNASLMLPADWAKPRTKMGKIGNWEVESPDKAIEFKIVWSDKKDVPDRDLKRSATRTLQQMKEGMTGGELQSVQLHGLPAFEATLTTKEKNGEVLLTFIEGAQRMYLIFGSSSGPGYAERMALIHSIEGSFQEGP